VLDLIRFALTPRRQCVSVVAILTLEVTGIPELSADREFPWPKPAFIARQTRSALQVFEVSTAFFPAEPSESAF
jgi:hypothetical protein